MSASSAADIGAAAASKLRLDAGIGNEPITDLWAFIRDQGVDLAFHGFGEEGPDGTYRYDGRHALIVVNSDRKPIARQRFTAAHELGHHVLHRKQGQPMRAADADVNAPTGGSRQESEAHAFAAYLLAPDAAMRAAFPGVEPADITVEIVVDLAHRFGVAVATTIYRLHNSGRIRAVDRDRLNDQRKGKVERLRTQKGYDVEEIHGAPLPPGFVTDIAALYDRGMVGIDRAAELLRTDVDTARAKLGHRPEAADFSEDEFLREIDAEFGESAGE
ncbi:MAG: ImmA/IrrE family metallo-endopeptidase [Actinobacteria bacterium]|nr:ImmA/IrrE family metallo-endopeptidase [Actinomycetota bacterium]